MIDTNEIKQLTKEFKDCQKSLSAIGDETRQHIIISLLESDCKGVRVGELKKKQICHDRLSLIIYRF